MSKLRNDERYHRLDNAHIVLCHESARPGRRRGASLSLGVTGEGVGGAGVARHPGFRPDGQRRAGAWIVERHNFPVCPICLGTEALTDEHVPMKALGGRVMTRTCAPCNNKIGSLSEEALRRLAVGEVQIELLFSGAGAPRGWRKATAIIRQDPDEPPILQVMGGDPALIEAVTDGLSFEARYTLFDQFPLGIALLKYAYLAACVWLRAIPQSGEAHSFRELLVMMRDGNEPDPSTRGVVGALVQNLVLVENASMLESLILVEPTEDQPVWTFVMAGRIAMRWPFDETLPSGRSIDRVLNQATEEVALD